MLHLMNEGHTERVEEVYSLPRLSEGVPTEGRSGRPLWLSPEEADLLVSLCFSSASDGGDAESEFFSKVGRFVRSFAG